MKYRFNSCSDIKRALARVANQVSEGSLDAKTANAIVYCAQTALTVKKLELLVDEKNDERELHLGLDFGKVFEV